MGKQPGRVLLGRRLPLRERDILRLGILLGNRVVGGLRIPGALIRDGVAIPGFRPAGTSLVRQIIAAWRGMKVSPVPRPRINRGRGRFPISAHVAGRSSRVVEVSRAEARLLLAKKIENRCPLITEDPLSNVLSARPVQSFSPLLTDAGSFRRSRLA